MVDVVVEKQVNALNGSIINLFRQGAASNHGVGSLELASFWYAKFAMQLITSP